MVSLGLFTALVATVACQRFCELLLSRKNERKLRSFGAVEHAPEQTRYLVFLQATWLPMMLLEVSLFDRALLGPLTLFALSLFALGQASCAAAMHALGPRWTINVLTVSGTLPVRHGIYRYLRHPNYVGLALETLALPLVHNAYVTSLVFFVAHAVLLTLRIDAEERALRAAMFVRAPRSERWRQGTTGDWR